MDAAARRHARRRRPRARAAPARCRGSPHWSAVTSRPSATCSPPIPTTPTLLSARSEETLGFQGGVMTAAEVAAFEHDPTATTSSRFRRADDAAKVRNTAVDSLDSWRPAVEHVSPTPRLSCVTCRWAGLRGSEQRATGSRREREVEQGCDRGAQSTVASGCVTQRRERRGPRAGDRRSPPPPGCACGGRRACPVRWAVSANPKVRPGHAPARQRLEAGVGDVERRRALDAVDVGEPPRRVACAVTADDGGAALGEREQLDAAYAANAGRRSTRLAGRRRSPGRGRTRRSHTVSSQSRWSRTTARRASVSRYRRGRRRCRDRGRARRCRARSAARRRGRDARSITASSCTSVSVSSR